MLGKELVKIWRRAVLFFFWVWRVWGVEVSSGVVCIGKVLVLFVFDGVYWTRSGVSRCREGVLGVVSSDRFFFYGLSVCS